MSAVLVKVADGVAVITLNRPEQRNAMSLDLVQGFREAVAQVGEDPQVRVVVVTGAGRAFSSGADFGTLPSLAAESGLEGEAAMRHGIQTLYAAFTCLNQLQVPTIAAVNGAAIGGGLGIALQCDLRIVAGRAKLGATFSRLGIHSGMGITKLLPEAVGDQLGRELLFTGRIFRGEEAAQAGFALKAVEFDQVLPEAMDLARRIAGAAPLAVQWIKRTLKDPSLKDQDAVMEAESAAQASLMQTRDAVEGLRAGVEGREPRFEGR